VNTIPASRDAKAPTGVEKTPPLIVAIDGPSGVGKSTVAKLIAARLGYTYLDSGALYRAVAWKALQAGANPTAPDVMRQLCGETRLTVSCEVGSGSGMAVEVDGRVLKKELRTPEVSRAASQVAALPEVRAWLLPVQQSCGRRSGIRGLVAEGRDMGTRVFPDAPVKFFLEAAPAERARRRHDELAASGRTTDLTETRRELEARDGRDRTRESAPLAAAPDAVTIDTSGLTIDEVVDRMLRTIERKAAAAR
jgi:cytidylate kinase